MLGLLLHLQSAFLLNHAVTVVIISPKLAGTLKLLMNSWPCRALFERPVDVRSYNAPPVPLRALAHAVQAVSRIGRLSVDFSHVLTSRAINSNVQEWQLVVIALLWGETENGRTFQFFLPVLEVLVTLHVNEDVVNISTVSEWVLAHFSQGLCLDVCHVRLGEQKAYRRPHGDPVDLIV